MESILNIPHDNDFGFFLEVELLYPNIIGEKTNNFPFSPENETVSKSTFSEKMEKKPKNYKPHKKTNCDWTDKKDLIHYGVLTFHFRHGVVVDKDHEISSYRQSKWLEKNINFNTQKNSAKKDFETISTTYSIMHFMEKQR